MTTASPSKRTFDRALGHIRLAREFVVGRNGRRAQIRRYYAFDSLRLVSKSVLVEYAGIEYYISTRDRAVGRSAFSGNPQESDLMARAIELTDAVRGAACLTGQTFIDVGANIGTSSIPALARYGAAKAICFEPSPDVARLLKCNLVHNGLEGRAKVFEIALSNQDGWVEFELCESNTGDGRVRVLPSDTPGVFGENTRNTVRVKTMCFDQFVQDGQVSLEEVGLVWIDVQGHEGQILAGAHEITGRDIPVVIEYWPYGLRRSLGLDLLHSIIATGYDRVIDIRSSIRDSKPTEIRASNVDALEQQYPNTEFTDLLLLK